MIPAGHEHCWQPFSTRDVGDGKRQVDSRCQCAGATVESVGTVIEQRVVVDEATGRVLSLQYRFHGLWFSPLDLLRIRPSTAAGPIDFCPACQGAPPAISGMPPCGTCHGVGVTVDGQAVVAPALSPV